MPFTLLTGTMGGGKSYYAAELAAKCWREGGVVHSNMDWDLQRLQELGYDKLHVELPQDPQQWQNVIVGAAEGAENLFIVDEAAMVFHSWDQVENRKRDRALFEILAMSRKLGLDIYFISQAAGNVSKALRDMANFQVRCTAVKRIPIIGPAWAKLRGDFLRIIKGGESAKVITSTYARFQPEIGSLYKTEALRGAAAQIERHPTRQATPLKTPLWLKITAALVFFAIPAGILHSCSQMGKENRPISGAPRTPPTQTPPIIDTAAKVTADTFVKPPAPRFTPSQQTTPRLHPYSDPSGRSSDWVEWDTQDERIICATYKGPQGLKYYLLGGEAVHLGAWLEGEPVMRIIPQGPEAFAITGSGRAFYLRKMTYAERRERDQHTLEQSHQRLLAPSGPVITAPPSTSIASQP